MLKLNIENRKRSKKVLLDRLQVAEVYFILLMGLKVKSHCSRISVLNIRANQEVRQRKKKVEKLCSRLF